MIKYLCNLIFFIFKGKGITEIRGGSRGDLLCRAIVETPQSLNKTQKELLRQFETSTKGKKLQNPLSYEWFEKVKSFFDTN